MLGIERRKSSSYGIPLALAEYFVTYVPNKITASRKNHSSTELSGRRKTSNNAPLLLQIQP